MAVGLLAGLGRGLLGLARAGRGAIGRGLSSPRVVQGLGALRTGLGTAATQAGRFGRAATQTAGRPMAGRAAAAGRTAGQGARATVAATKAIADDVTRIAQAAINASRGTSSAAKAAAARTAILQKYPQLGNVAGQVSSAIRSGRTSLAGLDIRGLVAATPGIAQSAGAAIGGAASRVAASPLGQRVGAVAQRANRATNPAVANPAADAAFGSVLAQGRNIGSQIGSGIGNQFNRIRSGIGSFGGPNQMSAFGGRFTMGGRNAAGGAYAQPGLMSQMRSGLGGFRNRFRRAPAGSAATASVGVPNVAGQIAANFTPMGALRATGRGLKGIGSFAVRNPIKTTIGTGLGIAYGPDAFDALTTKTPEQQLRQGVQSLVGTEENRERSIRDLAALYAQGELGNAIGTPGARNLAQQQMRQYVGGSIFGDEGYANIPMRGGTGMLGGEGMSTMSGDIFNNPARESIMKSFGMQMDDEEIIEKYSKILDKQRRKKSLNADDIRFLMMFEALNKPSNLPTDVFSRNAGFESARARQDVQNQLGGQFEVLDYNELYPTYAQPQTAINMAEGGEAFPDLNNDGELTYADILKGRGVDLRDGGEASGPGTGTSDSIPARLSDGEFVMTAKAVKGAGDGDRKEGVRKMYALMNNLEGR